MKKDFRFSLLDIENLFSDFSRDKIVLSPNQKYALYRLDRESHFEVKLHDENNNVIGQEMFLKDDLKKIKTMLINFLLSVNLFDENTLKIN